MGRDRHHSEWVDGLQGVNGLEWVDGAAGPLAGELSAPGLGAAAVPHAASPHHEMDGEAGRIDRVVRTHRWLLDAMLEQFPNGSINVFDADLRYVYAAGTGLDRVGLSPSVLIGRRLADLFPEDAVALVRPYYQRAFGGETVEFPLTVLGHEYTVHAWPLRQPSGPVVAIVAMAREASARHRPTELSPRQREVAVLIAAGLTNEQIAERLTITAGTVANHIDQIRRRLNVVRRAQIAVWAVECGLYGSESGVG